MKKSPACRVVAARLGIDQRRAVRLVQNLTEAGLVPSGYGRHDLSHRQLARVVIAAVARPRLHYAAQAVKDLSALESTGGLQLIDWLESLIAGRVNPDGILSLAIQSDPEPAVSVVTGATRLQFGELAADAAKGVVISGGALRNVIKDFQNGVG